MEIYVIDTGYFKLDGGAMFGVVPKSIWNKLYPADDQNLCTWAMRCLLIVEGDNRILIDTGIGKKQDEKFFSHYHLHGDATLLSSIKNAGFSPDDITDVVHTHLHFDHCGGSIKKTESGFEPTFKNAKLWVDRKQWEWAIHPNAREKASFLKENLLPMQDSGKLAFLPDSSESPWTWMKLFRCFGHTESMVLPIISYRNHNIAYCADLFPSVHHIPLPYIMGYDMRPLETLHDKENFFESALAENWLLFFEHDAHNECAYLVRSERGVRAGNGMTFNDWLIQMAN